MDRDFPLGAAYLGDGRCTFCVWAPLSQRVEVHVLSLGEQVRGLDRNEKGYHRGVLEDVEPGSRYVYRLDGRKERPDPASRFQPEGVHGPSQICRSDFPWEDSAWAGLPLKDYVIYELHVGAFTEEGTFKAVISRLDELKDLGITALELMPVAQFPGDRNWGYDGVYPFAVQHSYGGAGELKKLVSACHRKGLAVVLDVVYNHLGPEGNYLWDYGPYFTDRYKTPWGSAVNFDGPESDPVRRYFIENALYWVREFHVDALRLDAVHAIFDFSAFPFLEELAQRVHQEAEHTGRGIYLIAESALNDTRLIRTPEQGGFGLDAQWNDDFHHSLRAVLTGERSGYYQDFGTLHHLGKAFREGFVYSGAYSSFRRRRHGRSSKEIPAHRFVVFSQNHDQVGNRMKGERLSVSVSFEALKLSAGCVLLSPYVPLLFMGEEYGEKTAFPYFVSHSDPGLIESVRKGRKEEFAAFTWRGEPPDPQREETFLGAKLDRSLKSERENRTLFGFYKEIIGLRKEGKPLAHLSKKSMDVVTMEREEILLVRRWKGVEEWAMVFHFGKKKASHPVPLPEGRWTKRLDSADVRWLGPGSLIQGEIGSGKEAHLALQPESFVILKKKRNGIVAS
jgi:maltooligosyltrehalose trehalohydrolase